MLKIHVQKPWPKPKAVFGIQVAFEKGHWPVVVISFAHWMIGIGNNFTENTGEQS